MRKPKRKLTYPIGSVWTLGKPAQVETSLGKIVTIVATPVDSRRVVVADCEHPDKKAEVRIKNLGNKLAECATGFDTSPYPPARNVERSTSKTHVSGIDDLKHSFIGRLLEEISWQGPQVKGYRGGGLGLENVLTIEVFQALDFLPRTWFFSEVIGSAHGSLPACTLLRQEAERAEFFPLPGDVWLEDDNITKINVQPDIIVRTQSVYCFVEAKRLRQSSFQRLQLAREFLLTHKAKDKDRHQVPLLFLVLSKPPPVLVQGRGPQSLRDAIVAGLREIISQPAEIAVWEQKIDETVSWITWSEIVQIVRQNFSAVQIADPSTRASIERLVQSIGDSVRRHGNNSR